MPRRFFVLFCFMAANQGLYLAPAVIAPSLNHWIAGEFPASDFFFLVFIYLFLAVLSLSCDTQGLPCGLQDLLLWLAGFSLVGIHGFNCPVACGAFCFPGAQW